MKTKLLSNNINAESELPRVIALCALATLLLIALTGCKKDAASNASPDLAGVYTLVGVDGKAVPCEVSHEGADVAIKSGTFIISADGTCTSQITFSVASHGDDSREVKATFTRQGAELTMHWIGAGTTLGNVHGDTFTMTNEGMIFGYRK